jgi:hypothetical protein
MPRVNSDPPTLRPYIHHGIDLQWSDGDKHAIGTCPWCGRETFAVVIENGVWHCPACNQGNKNNGGNETTFIRMLWERSDKATNGKLPALASELGLLYPDSLMRWGICWSILTPHWLIPGYGKDKQINHLYKYARIGGRMATVATPEMHHQMHGVCEYAKEKPDVHLCEGWKDGVSWWEAMKYAKPDGDSMKFTASEQSSILASTNVLAVHSTGSVGKPLEKFLPLFAGKRVLLMFDSDHPRRRCTPCGKSWSTVIYTEGRCPTCGEELGEIVIPAAGFEATKRTVNILSSAAEPPAEIMWIAWGENGYDPDLPDGYDIRDALVAGTDGPSRAEAAASVLKRIQPIPAEWSSGQKINGYHSSSGNTVKCQTWSEFIPSWKSAIEIRQDIEDAAAAVLAVTLSTQQQGDQLCLHLVASPGSGKTRLADAMLTSQNCIAVESLTGFTSGWRSGHGEDYSKISQMNGKTLVTAEGDVLMKSKNFDELMAQMRRMFDGKFSEGYKTLKEDRKHEGLRTPWVMAVTPRMLTGGKQAALGDRFIRIYMDPPDKSEIKTILRRVSNTAFDEVCRTSGSAANEHMNEHLVHAYRSTGGYIDYLRENASELLSRVQFDRNEVMDWTHDYAEFAALFRAYPDMDMRKEPEEAMSELPTRLAHQFGRMAVCLGAVLCRWRIDSNVQRIIQKIAVHTSRGPTLNLARQLYHTIPKEEGMSMEAITFQVGASVKERAERLVQFLRKLGVVEKFNLNMGKKGTFPRYRLTATAERLYERAMANTFVGVT